MVSRASSSAYLRARAGLLPLSPLHLIIENKNENEMEMKLRCITEAKLYFLRDVVTTHEFDIAVEAKMAEIAAKTAEGAMATTGAKSPKLRRLMQKIKRFFNLSRIYDEGEHERQHRSHH